MKLFLFLSVLSFGAHAACDYQNAKDPCQANYQCAERAWKNGEAEFETYTEFSVKNNCQDQLRFAALLADEESTSFNTAKTELPVIPDAPARAPANSKE